MQQARHDHRCHDQLGACEGARIGDARGTHRGSNAANHAAAAAGGNMELMSSFYAKLDKVKAYHSLNVVGSRGRYRTIAVAPLRPTTRIQQSG